MMVDSDRPAEPPFHHQLERFTESPRLYASAENSRIAPNREARHKIRNMPKLIISEPESNITCHAAVEFK